MRINPRLENAGMDSLVEALLALNTREEAYALLEDLCTISELHDMAMRWEVARLLAAGEKYDTIESRTGASSATISRVKRALKYGADGYALIIKRLAKEE